MKKYINSATLLSFRETAVQGAEGEAVFELTPTRQILDCFILTEDVDYFKKLKVPKKLAVELSFCHWKLNKTDKKSIQVISIRKSPTTVNAYRLAGKVIEVTGELLIIDCGFRVILRDYEKRALKVGDWMVAEGRIDAGIA